MFRQLKPINYLIFLTIIITTFLSSCSKNEEKLLDDKTFSEVLAELMIIENLGIPEKDRIHLAENVFNKYKIDTTLFFRTRRFYKQDEEHWIKIYAKTEAIIRAKMDSLNIRNARKSETNINN